MKNLILSLVMSVVSLVSFSQTYQVSFRSHIEFDSGKHTIYEEVIKDDNILGSKLKSGGINTYFIDLDEKVVNIYFNNVFVSRKSIVRHKSENGLLFITLSDGDTTTTKEINSYIVINQDDMDRSHPFFTFYYTNTSGGTTNGIKTM